MAEIWISGRREWVAYLFKKKVVLGLMGPT